MTATFQSPTHRCPPPHSSLPLANSPLFPVCVPLFKLAQKYCSTYSSHHILHRSRSCSQDSGKYICEMSRTWLSGCILGTSNTHCICTDTLPDSYPHQSSFLCSEPVHKLHNPRSFGPQADSWCLRREGQVRFSRKRYKNDSSKRPIHLRQRPRPLQLPV